MSGLEIGFFIVTAFIIFGTAFLVFVSEYDTVSGIVSGFVSAIVVSALMLVIHLGMSNYSDWQTPPTLIKSEELDILHSRMVDYVFYIDYRDPDDDMAHSVKFDKIADFEKYQRGGKLTKNYYEKYTNFGKDRAFSEIEIVTK